MENESFISEHLELYLKYEYLTVDQYSTIISSINGLTKNLSRILIYGDLNYLTSTKIIVYDIPLCIQEVHTGNSIKTKITYSKKFFPELQIDNGDTLNISLPQWSSVIIIAGYILSYGMSGYKDYLEIKLKQQELDEKLKKELINQQTSLEKISSKPSSAIGASISRDVETFRSQLYLPNIKEAHINGQLMHQR